MSTYRLPRAIRRAIEREIIYRQHKWGPVTDDGGDPTRDVGAWLSILGAELRDAEEEWLEAEEEWGGEYNQSAALCEILQVVAVGIACLEQHGVVERPTVLSRGGDEHGMESE